MNRLFFVLLFLTISGFGVIWWLYASLPEEEVPVKSHANQGLVIEEDQKKVESGHAEEGSTAGHGEEHEKSESAAADHAGGTHGEVEKSEPAAQKTGQDHEGDQQDGGKKVEHAAAATGKQEEKSDSHHSSGPGEKSEDPSAASGAEKPKTGKSSIFVESNPAGAMVYVDGVLRGKSPFTFEILSSDKIVRMDYAGHERQERTIEAHHRAAGTLTRWKFDLKPQTETAKEADFQKTDFRLTGNRGPYFVQLKAVNKAENKGWLVAVQTFRDRSKSNDVYACDVDLGSKGTWIRFLAGPFQSKNEARAILDSLKKATGEKDAFVVGEQSCLE